MNFETSIRSDGTNTGLDADSAPRRRRALIIGGIVVALALVLAFVMFGRKSEPAGGPAPAEAGKTQAPEVTVVTPGRQPVTGTVSATGTLAAQGERLFRQFGCGGCHGAGRSVHAPALDGLYGKPVPLNDGTIEIADERFIRDSILKPRGQIVAGYEPVMPSYEGKISEDELVQITAYIKSLASAEAGKP